MKSNYSKVVLRYLPPDFIPTRSTELALLSNSLQDVMRDDIEHSLSVNAVLHEFLDTDSPPATSHRRLILDEMAASRTPFKLDAIETEDGISELSETLMDEHRPLTLAHLSRPTYLSRPNVAKDSYVVVGGDPPPTLAQLRKQDLPQHPGRAAKEARSSILEDLGEHRADGRPLDSLGASTGATRDGRSFEPLCFCSLLLVAMSCLC
jgi:hypothetical protein